MMDQFLDPRNNMPRVILDGMVRHNLQVRKHVLALSPKGKDTTALEIAALLHNVWRALPKSKASNSIKDEVHDSQSAEAAGKILKRLKAPADMIKKVESLVKNQSKGKTKEQQMLREADSISFLENTLPIWFESGLWLGQSSKELIETARSRINKEFNSLKSPEAKQIAKKYVEKWTDWLEQKENG